MTDRLACHLIVEATDLDTDARTTHVRSVPMPHNQEGQRAQIVEVVGALHPRARLRSFSTGVASFLDSEHLVVARYERAAGEPSRTAASEAAPQTEQQPLFVG